MFVEGGVEMVTVGLLVRLAAKPGKELELERFLRSALPLVEDEPDTTVWFALKFGPFSFGIFDAFPHDIARQAHLAGRVAAALMARAPDLLAAPPDIEQVDTLASKLPGPADALLHSRVSGRQQGANDE
jgi:quinol monooxygenase YgiN